MWYSLRRTPALALRLILSGRDRDHRIWLCLLAVIVALYAPMQNAGTANAATLQTSAATAAANTTLAQALTGPPDCSTFVGGPCPAYPPLPLLNLDHPVLGVTAAQRQSLENLEDAAVQMVIKMHGLSDGDKNAVLSWGRNDALAALYMEVLAAIDAKAPTDDQKNVVAWLETMIGPGTTVTAAQDAAREYVKWAGLDQSAFDALLRTNPSESQLKAFMGGDNPEPLNYNNTNTSLATGGYCVYRSPSPDQNDYKGYLAQQCYAPCITCLPPAPTYDQFVKYGDDVANATWAGGADAEQQAKNIAAGLAIFPTIAVATAAAAAQLYRVYSYALALETVADVAAADAAAEATSVAADAALATFFVGNTVTLLGVVLAAIVTAVLAGITVANQAKLPGKLASLVATAESTKPDLVSLKNTTAGAQTIFGLFVAATLPVPIYGACDNADKTRGLTMLKATIYVVETGAPPCLNPTQIPAASVTDPQFVVQPNGASTTTLSPTISWKDNASGTTTQARLNKTWFITTDASGKAAQSLSIVYTDWQGKEQRSWLVGDNTNGYGFLTYPVGVDATKNVDTTSCTSSGFCSDTMYYVGADGTQYSAKVRGYAPPTGTPIVSTANPIEGSPVKFDAHNFAPGNPTGAISYQWRFQKAGCGAVTCQAIGGAPQAGGAPAYEDPVTGASVEHTWGEYGQYSVQLTATDAIGATGSTTFSVSVQDVAPTLTVDSDTRTGQTAAAMLVKGTITDPGGLATQNVSINWGDGHTDSGCIATQPLCFTVGSPLKLTATTTATGATFTFNVTHAYANPGTYFGMVSVTDGALASGSTFAMTISPIKFPAIADHDYGDNPTISATGSTSGSPIAFAVTGVPGVCSVSGSGTATVTLLKTGTCVVTARDPGEIDDAHTDPPVTQTFAVKPAALTITASSPTITYGDAQPAITPIYSGFVKGDTESVLDTRPTCAASVPTPVTAGTYTTGCTGGSDANYAITQVPGMLTIKKATPTVALVIDKASVGQGQPVTLTATVAAPSQGAPKPTGSVSFLDGIDAISTCSGTLDPTTGTATCSVSNLTVGGHQINAHYLGDTNYLNSWAPLLPPITVNLVNGVAATTTPTISTTTTISVSAAPALAAKPVTFTASVSGSGTPAGTVTFFDGTTSLGAAPVQVIAGKAQSTFTTSSLPMGKHMITARYDGTAGLPASTSTAIELWVSLDPATLPRNFTTGGYIVRDLPAGVLAQLYLANSNLGGNLTGTIFVGADLTGSGLSDNFTNADFSHARLANVQMGATVFKGANFSNADLSGANLSNANFSGAIGLAQAMLTNVTWFNTVCPDGTNSSQNGRTCIGHL